VLKASAEARGLHGVARELVQGEFGRAGGLAPAVAPAVFAAEETPPASADGVVGEGVSGSFPRIAKRVSARRDLLLGGASTPSSPAFHEFFVSMGMDSMVETEPAAMDAVDAIEAGLADSLP